MSDWPKHPDGRNMKIGEMTREQAREVTQRAGAKLQAEANDPNLVFAQTCLAILTGPDLPRTAQ